MPIVNVLLISLNTLVFLYELQLGGLGLVAGSSNLQINLFFFQWGFIPDELTHGVAHHCLPGFRPCVDITSPIPTLATVFSSMFIHGSLLHFGGNMLFLWVFGDNIEDWLGHSKYLLFYLLTGAIAALSQLAISPYSDTPLIGASGAISGVLGAYLVLYPFNRIRVLLLFIFITVARIPAIVMLGVWILLQVYNGLGSVGTTQQAGVAHFAHIGGFLAGVVIIIFYKLFTRKPARESPHRAPWDYRYRG